MRHTIQSKQLQSVPFLTYACTPLHVGAGRGGPRHGLGAGVGGTRRRRVQHLRDEGLQPAGQSRTAVHRLHSTPSPGFEPGPSQVLPQDPRLPCVQVARQHWGDRHW